MARSKAPRSGLAPDRLRAPRRVPRGRGEGDFDVGFDDPPLRPGPGERGEIEPSLLRHAARQGAGKDPAIAAVPGAGAGAGTGGS